MGLAAISLSRRHIVIRNDWAENQTIGEKTRIFFAPDRNMGPNFELEVKFLLNKRTPNVYESYVLKSFDSEDEAEKFIIKKKSIFPIKYDHTNRNVFVARTVEIQEHIDLSDSSSSETENLNMDSSNSDDSDEDPTVQTASNAGAVVDEDSAC